MITFKEFLNEATSVSGSLQITDPDFMSKAKKLDGTGISKLLKRLLKRKDEISKKIHSIENDKLDGPEHKKLSNEYRLCMEYYKKLQNIKSYAHPEISFPPMSAEKHLTKKYVFKKVNYDYFERIADSSEDYSETEINGYGVIAVYKGKNCIGLWYKKAKTGSHCDSFKGDMTEYSEADTNWPYD